MIGRRRTARRRDSAAVEMTPLIDMVFILLIFFIVTTAFVRDTGVTIDAPRSDTASKAHDTFILLAITKGGSVHAAGTRIAPDDATTVGRLLDEAGANAVIVQADRQAPLGIVLQVQDTAVAAGALDVRIGALPQ